MKKTLIAVAALAATSAFAQVTITGEYAYGYSATTATTGDASGLGTNTSELYINAMEDLGSGMSVKARMTIGGLDRGNALYGGDGSLALVTPSGTLSMNTTKGADYLTAVAGQGVNWDNMDGKVFTARTSRDGVSFAFPAISGINFSVGHSEEASVLGEGSGQTGSSAATGSRINSIAASYAAGPLAVAVNYLDYLEKGTTDATTKNVVRGGGTYNLGSFSLGLGASQATAAGNQKIVDTLASLKVPMNAFTFGATFASRNVADSTVTTNGSRSGYTLSAWYNLSKTTYLTGQYTRYDATVAAASANTLTHLLLVKDF